MLSLWRELIDIESTGDQGLQCRTSATPDRWVCSLYTGCRTTFYARLALATPAGCVALQRISRGCPVQPVSPACVHRNSGALLQAHSLHCFLQRALLQQRFLCRAMAAPTSAFDIPAAPILIPKGPWKEVDGCVCAPKGFKAQGEQDATTFRVVVSTHHRFPRGACPLPG